MAAERDSPRLHAHRRRLERPLSPCSAERHTDSDRAVRRSNSLRERNADSHPILDDLHTQSPTIGREDDRRCLESETRRHTQVHTSALPPTADSIHPYYNTQVPNQSKIYIGGLPEFTKLEDLHDCFSQLGRIKNVELKNGYGFVEYDNPESAGDAVAKYHEGTFLGSQIKVEISHGGSRPRHVAVSNNPEACYTCGVAGHWARDCPEADNQPFHKRRMRPRSRSPPRGREDGYIHRDSRQALEVIPHEHNRFRRRSPLGPIDYIRDDHKRLAPTSREPYPLAAYNETKRLRPDHSLRARERDHQRELDLKVLPHQDHRDSYKIQSLSRTRGGQNDWPYECFSKSAAHQRNSARAHEPFRLGGYDDRSYLDQQLPYPVERLAGSNFMDTRYNGPDARFPRGESPRRFRSPRRSLSPPRRASYRNSSRAHSPSGSRIGHYSGSGDYTRTSSSMRR